MKRNNRIRRACVGLFAAWALHDAEEYLTMAPTSREVFSGLPEQLPIPEEFRARGISQVHVNLAMSAMGAVVAASAASGVRSGGRSTLFRGGLLAFGLHGFTHIASCLVAGRYTTGVVTSPLVVIPYWLWARRVLKQHGIRPEDPKAVVTALAVFPALAGIHALVRKILGEGSLGPEISGTAV